MVDKRQHYEIILSEIARHLEDSETSKLAHWSAASVYEKRHKFYLGLPTTIISLLLTWLLSTQFTQSGLKERLDGNVILYITVFFSLIVSILSGLLTFLNFNDLAIKHRTAAENYHALWRDCKNWETDFPDESKISQATHMVQQYRRRISEINRDSPQIPKWAWKNAQEQKKEGSTTYDSLPAETKTKQLDE